MDWHEDTLAAFDVETTGLDVLNDRVVQAAALLIEPDGSLMEESWSGIIWPGVEIPSEASDIHGITTEIAKEKGADPTSAFVGIANVFNVAAAEGIPVVMYNAPFDWPFLLAEARRVSVVIPDVSIIDPLICDRIFDRYRRGKRTLEATSAYYGIPLHDAHDAHADAIASAAVARVMAENFPEFGETKPATLHAAQVGWFKEWAEDFARYRRNRGEDDDIDSSWPLPTKTKDLRGRTVCRVVATIRQKWCRQLLLVM